MVILIIYLIGFMAALVLAMYCETDKFRIVIVRDIALSIVVALLSWIGFIIVFYEYFSDTVVYEKKKK